ncbi:MAG: Rpn family recombination-promoting nuclease/putative transposase [Burkholderiales bacterium]|nr:Rpn family recombination-promoting nuclease/putative transposase [Burkholderiales bacterium]
MITHKLVRFDWAMKELLRNKVNFDILEGFLSELLQEPIKIKNLLESESNKKDVDDKFNRVDLLVSTSTNETIIIEVQTASEWDFYHRILFGTSKVVTEYLKEGDPYRMIPRVISVSILFFDLGMGSDYVYKGTTEFFGVHTHEVLGLTDKSMDLYIKELDKNYSSPSDIFPTYYLIQLNKFKNVIKDKFDQWVYLLKNEAVQEDFDAQGIRSANDKLNVLRLSPKEKQAYDKHWQHVSFEASLAETHQVELRQAKREGREEGREEGGEQKAIEIARKMLAKENDISEIADLTGLTFGQIEKLQREAKISD